MHNIDLKSIIISIISVVFLFLTICISSNTPTATLSIKITQLQEYLKHNKPTNSAAVLKEGIRDIIKPVFDLEEMSRRSLGVNWPNLTPIQQKEFINLFSTLLLSLYIDRLKDADKSEIKFVNEDKNDSSNISIVYTKVITEEETVEINYKLILKDSEWKIYDIIIENIGLVSNYRSEFTDIIRKFGVEGLLEKLRDKLRKVHAS